MSTFICYKCYFTFTLNAFLITNAKNQESHYVYRRIKFINLFVLSGKFILLFVTFMAIVYSIHKSRKKFKSSLYF